MRHFHHPAVLHQSKFDRLLARSASRLPDRLARAMAWLVSPSAFLLRLPLGILFIIGGIFSFLPVLGVWMLPLGILLDRRRRAARPPLGGALLAEGGSALAAAQPPQAPAQQSISSDQLSGRRRGDARHFVGPDEQAEVDGSAATHAPAAE